MNAALTVGGAWIVALAIALPFVILFWWARRNEPVTGAEVDYSVGRRTTPPADLAGHAAAPGTAASVEAPVMANPAALAPLAESVVPPASTVALPENAPLPAEPRAVATAPTAILTPEPPAPAVTPVITPTPASAPILPPVVKVTPPAPTPAPVVPVVPVVAAKPPAPTPVVVAPPVARPKPAPEPVVPPPAPVAEKPAPPAPEPVALEPEPEPSPEPQPAMAEAAPAASVEPPAEADDFTRLYGLDSGAIAALQGAGIYTYRELAAANVANLREILAAAGQPDTDPSMWPQQGRFASNGKWKQLETRFKPK